MIVTSQVGAFVTNVAAAVTPNWIVPFPSISHPSGIWTITRSHALAVAGVADLTARTIGVLAVVTAPAVFIRKLKVVAWAVAVLLPLVAKVIACIRNRFPFVMTKEVPVDVAPVSALFVSVIAVSVPLVPDAEATE